MAADRKKHTRRWAAAIAVALGAIGVMHAAGSLDATSAPAENAGLPDQGAPQSAATAAGGEEGDQNEGAASADASLMPGDGAASTAVAQGGANKADEAATALLALPTIGQEVFGATESELRRVGAARNQEQATFYRDVAQYPSANRVLAAGRDPLIESSSGSHAKGLSPDGHSLELATSDWAVVSGNSITIGGTLRDAGGDVVPIVSARAMLMDTAMTGYEEIVALNVEASGAVKGSFTAPDASTVSQDPGIHKLVLEAKDALGHTYMATSALQVSASSVSLTGRLRESPESGGLSIEAELRVTASTRVHLAMTLAPSDAIDGIRVLAQNSVLLSPGVQWVPVRFAGISLQALKKSGPYRVTAVQLHDVSSMPPARAPLLEPGFITQAYSLSSFDAKPANDKWLSTMARFLENR